MATQVINRVLQGLRRAALHQGHGGPSDADLLDAFLLRNDQLAFEALVRLHGPLVLGLCRRLLGNPHDAEDAFQAVFLVLVQKARSIRTRAALGAWLYGVAYRTSLKVRARRQRRQARESPVASVPERGVEMNASADDLPDLLDEEINALPEKYLLPLVMCELQGQSRREAARALKLAEGTLSSRLAAARRMLRERLARRGIVLSAGALSMTFASVAAAGVPTSLVLSTVKAASAAATGGLTAGMVSAKVLALKEVVVKAMFMTKLKTGAGVLLAIGLVGGGIMLLGSAFAQIPEGAASKADTLAKHGEKEQAEKKDAKRDALEKVANQANAGVQRELSGASRQDFAGVPKQPAKVPAVPKGWKELGEFKRHSDQVVSVALSTELLAVGCKDGTIRLWDFLTGKDRGTVGVGHGGGVASLMFSLDGQYLFSSGTGDNQMMVVDTKKDIAKQGSYSQSSLKPEPEESVVFAKGPEEKSWAHTLGGRVRIAELDLVSFFTGKLGDARLVGHLDGHAGKVRAVAFSGDGKVVATGGDDKTVRVWDPVTLKTQAVLNGHADAVTFVTADLGGKAVASIAKDKAAKLWDVATGKERASFTGQGGVRCAAFSPDGTLLATGGDDGTVKMWDVRTGKEGVTLKGHKDAVRSVAFSPDGKTLASGSQDKTAKLWQVGELPAEVKPPAEAPVQGIAFGGSVAAAPAELFATGGAKDKDNRETKENPLKVFAILDWVEPKGGVITAKYVSGKWEAGSLLVQLGDIAGKPGSTADEVRRELLKELEKLPKLVNVPVGPDAKIASGSAQLKLRDLRAGMAVSLQIAADNARGLAIVGIQVHFEPKAR